MERFREVVTINTKDKLYTKLQTALTLDTLILLLIIPIQTATFFSIINKKETPQNVTRFQYKKLEQPKSNNSEMANKQESLLSGH